MDPLAELRRRLASHSDLTLREEDDGLVVAAPSPDGFEVGLTRDALGFSVHLGDWHDHFEDAGDAIEIFVMGLSGRCRVETTYRGDRAVRFTLLYQEGDDWLEDSSVGPVFKRFWGPSRTEVRQNPRRDDL